MNRNLLVALAVVVLIVIVGGFFYLQNNENSSSPSPSPTQEATQNPTPSPSPEASVSATPDNSAEEASVSATQAGFVPQSLTVKSGTTVTWTNNSGVSSNVSSANHPTHALWPFLNLGTFGQGQSISVVFDALGTYTYHNHLVPSQKGTVIVE